MAKTVLNVKTDVAVKKAAQKLAKEIGVPLSTIVNAQLKRFIAERRIELAAPLVPSASLRRVLDRAKKAGPEDYVHFDSIDDAIAHIENL